MAKQENLPFEIGTTYFGTDQTPTATGGANLEGKEYEVEDLDYGSSNAVKPMRTNLLRKVKIVRNVGAAAWLPGFLVSFKQTAGQVITGQVDGMARTTAQGPVFPVDEFLPSTGCAINDLCYVVTEGPAVVKTDLAGAANNVWSLNDWAVALTAATSGATTAGRVKPQDLTGATAVLGIEIQHRIGRAMSVKTTANTNASLLINVTRW